MPYRFIRTIGGNLAEVATPTGQVVRVPLVGVGEPPAPGSIVTPSTGGCGCGCAKSVERVPLLDLDPYKIDPQPRRVASLKQEVGQGIIKQVKRCRDWIGKPPYRGSSTATRACGTYTDGSPGAGYSYSSISYTCYDPMSVDERPHAVSSSGWVGQWSRNGDFPDCFTPDEMAYCNFVAGCLGIL